MAIAEMRKVTILARLGDRDGIMTFLQKKGVMELVEPGGELEEASVNIPDVGLELSRLDECLTRLKYTIDFFDRFEKVKKSLIQQFAGAKMILTQSEFGSLIAEEDEFAALYKGVRTLDGRISSLGVRASELQKRIEELGPWEWLDIPLEELEGSGRVRALCGSLAGRDREGFLSELRESSLHSYFEEGPGQGRIMRFVIFYPADEENALLDIMRRHSVTRHGFPGLRGTAREAAEAARAELAGVLEETGRAEEEVKPFLARRSLVYALYDHYSLLREQKASLLSCLSTRETFVCQGWAPLEEVGKLQEELTRRFSPVAFEAAEPGEDEDVPVLLSNSPLVTPFEAVTDIYSMPHRRGIDPTPYLAPFFFIFFGMCLGDVGYGLGLTAISLILLRKVVMAGTAKKLFTLLAIGGVASAVVGVLTGGWLGNLIKIRPLMFNPLENPMLMLGISLGLGLIQIFTGLGIKFYMNVKSGHVLDAIYDQGSWVAFLTGLLMLGIGPSLGVAGVGEAGKVVTVIGAAGLILTQGRAHKNLLKRLGSGLLSLYGLSGYLSDVLSYSRLLALGLASGVIATVIDDLALRLWGIPVVGWLATMLLLAAGHAFNLGINVIGSYVHSSRLQYVEFFTKFFEGGGRKFRPFGVRTKYIELLKE